MRVDIYIGDKKLDMFSDENVSLKSSIADVQDITKNTTDFTRDFTVPASDNNNILFKHYYDADIDNGFDARVKVSGRIDLDGMLFREGKWRLQKVSVKQGLPSAYTIIFWGNLLSIKDELGKDELSDLDMSAFNHDYNSANVKTGLTTSLFSGDLVYNLFVKKQLFYSSDPSNTTITDDLINIGWGNGSGSNGVLFSDLRPSIRVIKIIEAIEADYPITFSRHFFGRTEFTDLFAWVNPSKDSQAGGGEQLIDWDGGDSTYLNHTTDKGVYPIERNDRHWRMLCNVVPGSGFEQTQYTVRCYVDDEIIQENTYIGTKTQQATVRPNSGNTPREVFWTVAVVSGFEFSSTITQQFRDNKGGVGGGLLEERITTSSSNVISSTFDVALNFPKLTILDFIKGLFKMFKCVVIPLPDGTTYVNTLKSFYQEGGIFDITDFVDFKEYDVARGEILNEINFLFEEPSTILNKQFEENTRTAYGDAEIKLSDEEGTILDGETLEFTLPFEQIVYERLNDINDTEQTNIMYGSIVDENIKPVNPKLHLFYNINQSISTKTIGFINDVGGKEQLSGNINTPSHTIGFESSNFSTIFDSEFSNWNGEKINNTLYTNYHEDYILSIFNVKRRNFRYKAVLPLIIMLKLELNDVLQIKDNYFRIDSFESNLVTGDVTLNLINSFDNTIQGFSASPTEFFIDYMEQQVSTYVTNLGNFSFNKVDNGSGIDWVTVSNDISNVFFDVEENEGNSRDIFIDLTNLVTLQEIRIYINQSVKVITSDNNVITSDNDEITSDNG